MPMITPTKLSNASLSDLTTDLLVLPVADGQLRRADIAGLDAALGGALLAEARRRGFQGRRDETLLLPTHRRRPAGWILLIGSGTPALNLWYTVADTATRTARELRVSRVAVALGGPTDPSAAAALAAGVRLAAYRFTCFRSQSDTTPAPVLTIQAPRLSATLRAAVRHADIGADATCYARDLINTPAADLPPLQLARAARRLAATGLRVTVHRRSALARLRMGAILGVGQGSRAEPCLIEILYRPRTKPTRRIALVGKGITFDSGGLCLKTGDGMRSQKRDMAGGAVVLAVMRALPALQPNVEVHGYVPAAENMPGGNALRPGDVVRACNGKTVEVLNTDAEGRLVLADALAYAARRRPDVILDFATLTAAVGTALGNRYAGIMGSDPTVVSDCIAAATAVNEGLWQLPLVDEYRRDLDSSIADLKNIGEGQAGTIIGGLFLREFTAGLPWAHIDFSSTAVSTGHPCHPNGATGFGVRTVLEYLLRS